MYSYHWRRNITLLKWYMWSIFICEMWMYLYEEQETCQNTYIYYICVFPPAAGETPDTWTTQTQLPWQRQTSQISVTSLQTQSLTQTVCASLMLKFIKKKNINFSAACHVWRRQTDIFPLGLFFLQEEQISKEAKVRLFLAEILEMKSSLNIFNSCSLRCFVVHPQPIATEGPPSQQEPPPPSQPVQRQTPPLQIPRYGSRSEVVESSDVPLYQKVAT